MSSVKRQHTVPRVYLKQFTGTGQGEKVYCLDKQHRYVELRHIKKVARENYFYDEPGQQPLETQFAQGVENYYGQIIPEIMETGMLSGLTRSDRDHLFSFVAAQDGRTKEKRALILDALQQLLQSLGRDLDEEVQEAGLDQKLKEFGRESHRYLLDTAVLDDLAECIAACNPAEAPMHGQYRIW